MRIGSAVSRCIDRTGIARRSAGIEIAQPAMATMTPAPPQSQAVRDKRITMLRDVVQVRRMSWGRRGGGWMRGSALHRMPMSVRGSDAN